MSKTKSSTSIMDLFSFFWKVKEVTNFVGTSPITVECKKCNTVTTKAVKKILEAARKGKSGCQNCHALFTKSEEYSKIMAKRSAPAGSEVRARQSAALSKTYSALTPEERRAKYGNSERWTEEERQKQSKRLVERFAQMSSGERQDKFGKANKNPEKIEKQRKSIKKTWRDKTRAERSARGTLKLMEDGRGVAEYANSKSVPLVWVHRIYNLFGPSVTKKYIDDYDGHTTDIELIIEDCLGIKKFNKKTLNKYRPDFKINDTLYVNVDGIWWHKEETVGKTYHYDMRVFFEQNGCRIMQFYAPEIYSKLAIVKSIISNASGQNIKKVHARKCQIVNVSKKDTNDFLGANHLMGPINGTSAFGLVCDGLIVSLMTVSRSDDGIEIDRFCNALGTSVPGGFTKLLAHVEGLYKPSFIKNWIDLRYGTGKFLENIGFFKEKDILSWKWTDGNNLFSRQYCMANMDERGLSQEEHAKEKRLVKIFDAGQRLYIKRIVQG